MALTGVGDAHDESSGKWSDLPLIRGPFAELPHFAMREPGRQELHVSINTAIPGFH
jgi:hypothetical protein